MDKSIETSIEVFATVGAQNLQASSFGISLEVYDCLSWFQLPTVEDYQRQMGSGYFLIIA